ncbi:MAG: DUF4389 domain-containing protein [Pseudomonadales bacterium]|nr:DUF4389 domain-containing protein [Pseudomonadales bacterium]
MQDQTKANLTNESIWVRLIYMVVLGIAYAVAEAVVFVVAIFQFLAALITGQVNRPLHDFSANLAVYVLKIVQFQTFNTEEKPFPFSDWPDAEVGETPWRKDYEDYEEDAETVSENASTDQVAPEAEVVESDPPTSTESSADDSNESKPAEDKPL